MLSLFCALRVWRTPPSPSWRVAASSASAGLPAGPDALHVRLAHFDAAVVVVDDDEWLAGAMSSQPIGDFIQTGRSLVCLFGDRFQRLLTFADRFSNVADQLAPAAGQGSYSAARHYCNGRFGRWRSDALAAVPACKRRLASAHDGH
ncbi:MAG: hypothetical protein H0W48_13335 [Methylibium sp.]|nr:hypothetical protein [Methylibium sp.]